RYLAARSVEVIPNDREFRGQAVEVHEHEVVAVYDQLLGSLVEELALMLQRVRLPRASALLLAGQSSLFPLVRRRFEHLAEMAEFVQDGEGRRVLKECVSLGAVLYSLDADLPDKVSGSKRLWTRLGRPYRVLG